MKHAHVYKCGKIIHLSTCIQSASAWRQKYTFTHRKTCSVLDLTCKESNLNAPSLHSIIGAFIGTLARSGNWYHCVFHVENISIKCHFPGYKYKTKRDCRLRVDWRFSSSTIKYLNVTPRRGNVDSDWTSFKWLILKKVVLIHGRKLFCI